MPLISTLELLKHARKNKYGVAAFNTFNYESVYWAVKAAEAERVPVIVQLYPGYDFHIPPEYIAYMGKDIAEKANVPVAVHLDHSAGYDIAVKGIKDGFPSVMFDGSTLPFEENIAVTASVVKLAAVFGVDIEAELGHVGSAARADDFENADLYTVPEQAETFARRSGCGSLAVSVGNAHGPYVKTPSLDFNRIKAIADATDIPLVLHGCSGIPDDQMQRAVSLGMCKFNIATEYFRAIASAMRERFDSGENDAAGIFFNLRERILPFLRGKLLLLNPGRVSP